MYEQPIVENFNQLLQHLDRLTDHLSNLPNDYFWLDQQPGTIEAQEIIINAINNLDTVDGTAQETWSCPGAIRGNTETFTLAENFNEAKDQFKQSANAYLTEKKSRDTKLIRNILTAEGHLAIKLKHVYRHVHLIDFQPRRIAFTKVKHNSHRIIDKTKAYELLTALSSAQHIQVQCSLLNQLGATEKLVIHRDVKPIWAVNISTFKNEENKSVHQKQITSLPVIYLHNPELPAPEILFSKPYANRQAQVRKDKKIEDIPFLPSISAYRYK